MQTIHYSLLGLATGCGRFAPTEQRTITTRQNHYRPAPRPTRNDKLDGNMSLKPALISILNALSHRLDTRFFGSPLRLCLLLLVEELSTSSAKSELLSPDPATRPLRPLLPPPRAGDLRGDMPEPPPPTERLLGDDDPRRPLSPQLTCLGDKPFRGGDFRLCSSPKASSALVESSTPSSS